MGVSLLLQLRSLIALRCSRTVAVKWMSPLVDLAHVSSLPGDATTFGPASVTKRVGTPTAIPYPTDTESKELVYVRGWGVWWVVCLCLCLCPCLCLCANL
jgi:hypothetical protein